MSDSIKSQIIDNVILRAAAIGFEHKLIEMLQMLLWSALKDYNITPASKELTTNCVNDQVLINRWLANKRLEGRSRKTIEMYRTALDIYTRHVRTPLIKTQTGDIKFFLASKMASGVSPVTCNNYRRYLNSFFTWATEEGLIAVNPMIRVKQIKEPKVLKEPFSHADIEKLREACKTTKERALIETLLSTACRVGEIASAKITNLQLRAGVLKVVGKGNKERVVYLNAVAKIWLEKYLSEREDKSNALFLTNRGESPLQVGRIETILRDLGARAGVERCHPHRFRRTAATWAIRQGMKLEQVQQMLGHEKITTTTIYTTISQKDVQIAHERYMGGD